MREHRYTKRRYRKYLYIPVIGALALALAACGGMGEAGSGAAESGGEAVPAPEAGEPVAEEVLTGLEAPWEVAFAPDGRTFITERPGVIRVMEGEELQEEPYFDPEAEEIGEGGQLGLALDPEFEENGYLYTYYTTTDENGELLNRLSRLTEENGGVQEDETLMEFPAATTHNGGRIAFGPDEILYITLGDANEESLAQDREALAGKILRVNPDGSVPEDNPFPGSPVYSEGHRNPQGLTWQPETDQLYAPEHGPSGHDEVNRIEAGENYGWPEVAGAGGEPDFADPVVESGESTWAPSGATFATEGPYAGDLFFTGLRGSALYRLVLDESGESAAEFEALFEEEFGRLRTVVEGPDGELYVLTNNTDGRGTPQDGDDRLLRVTFEE